uniref:Knottins-like domain-containing protein n=1 Tax=Leersia perrieri TaxID=77586 RepID=A0A0D9VDN2_9ORYZ
MEHPRRLSSATTAVVLLLLLVAIAEMGTAVQVGGNSCECEYPSGQYKLETIGKCDSHKCAKWCKQEGYTDGTCDIWKKKCVCTKKCPRKETVA